MENNNDDGVVKVNLQDVADKQNAEQEVVHKVDLSKPPTDEVEDIMAEIEAEVEEVQEVQEVTEVPEVTEVEAEKNDTTEVEEDLQEEVMTEITDEEVEELEEELTEAVAEAKATGKELPEGIQKLVDFMEDTGGSLEDYLTLNKDVSNLSEAELLKEYHASQEPDLTSDEIDFLMDDLYGEDDEYADERDKKKKSIARKRALSKAKTHFEESKDKYYEEIKAGSKLTPDQKKAVDFFNRYTEDQEENTKLTTKQLSVFNEKTNNVFGDKFKGFEFKVGEKRYRYNVKDVAGVKKSQGSLENFTKKYLGDDNTLSDAKGYHKALFTAMNADAIAEHFYNQGAADAVKNSAASKKNINMDPRVGHNESNTPQTGFRARVVSDTSTRPGKLRIKK